MLEYISTWILPIYLEPSRHLCTNTDMWCTEENTTWAWLLPRTLLEKGKKWDLRKGLKCGVFFFPTNIFHPNCFPLWSSNLLFWFKFNYVIAIPLLKKLTCSWWKTSTFIIEFLILIYGSLSHYLSLSGKFYKLINVIKFFSFHLRDNL